MGLVLYSLTVPNAVDINAKFYGPPANPLAKRDNHYKHRFSETVSLSDEIVYQSNIAILKKVASSNAPPPPSFAKRVQRIQRVKAQIQMQTPEKTQEALLSEAVKRVIETDPMLKDDNLVLVENQTELDEWLNPRTLAKKYTTLIDEHLRRRANNFLYQLANCFGTKLHFEVGKTQDQGESAKLLKADLDNEEIDVCTRNAAHSSTFPCLIAYDETEWNLFKNGGVRPQGIDYLKGSDLYKSENSTIAMPLSINQADIRIDGTHHNSVFSCAALNLLNQVSNGTATPLNAMKDFFESLTAEINKQIEAVQKDIIAQLKKARRGLTLKESKTLENYRGAQKALEIYALKVIEIQNEFISDPNEWIFAHLDLMINQQQGGALLATMLRLRCEALKRNMRGQAEILSKINILAEEVLTSIKMQKSPPHFHESFKAVLIDSMRTDNDKKRMKQLFALNGSPRGDTNLDVTKAKIIADRNLLQKIESLARTISQDMRSMKKEEENHRGDSMRKLRESRGWTQLILGEKLRQLYPFQPSSTSTIGRTERAERPMSNVLAQQLSETFDVPKELLLPQFFFV